MGRACVGVCMCGLRIQAGFTNHTGMLSCWFYWPKRAIWKHDPLNPISFIYIQPFRIIGQNIRYMPQYLGSLHIRPSVWDILEIYHEYYTSKNLDLVSCSNQLYVLIEIIRFDVGSQDFDILSSGLFVKETWNRPVSTKFNSPGLSRSNLLQIDFFTKHAVNDSQISGKLSHFENTYFIAKIWFFWKQEFYCIC